VRLTIVTPVGPGHERVAAECAASVAAAWAHSPGPFTFHAHVLQNDSLGELGRSRARNTAVAANPDADWYFFIDADDLCDKRAFDRFGQALAADADVAAVFGAVCTDRNGVVCENVYPLDWARLMRHGPDSTLAMGCFVRADAARSTPFDEGLDAGEDFDFYLRLLDPRAGRRWVKVGKPLVTIRTRVPSATGPRGYEALDWRAACRGAIDRWKRSRCRILP
jgi:glycosyltransferase involved in cell wall biosynthesis